MDRAVAMKWAMLLLTACHADVRSSMGTATIDGPNGPLRIDDGGDGGTPVIFVHGLAGDHHVWDETLAHVRAHRRALALDLHGFGESVPAITSDDTVGAMAADVVEVVEVERFPRFVIVGHSYGGDVAIAVAARWPDRVAGVVLVDASADFTSLPADQRAAFEKGMIAKRDELWDQLLVGSAPGVKQRVLPTLAKTKADVFARTLDGMLAFDPKPALAAYKGPRIAIVSETMDKFPNALQHVMKIETHVVPGTSHWVMLDKPADFDELLDSFLARAN